MKDDSIVSPVVVRVSSGRYTIQSLHPGPGQGKYLSHATGKGAGEIACTGMICSTTSLSAGLISGLATGSVLIGLATLSAMLPCMIVLPVVGFPIVWLLKRNALTLSSTRKDRWSIQASGTTPQLKRFNQIILTLTG